MPAFDPYHLWLGIPPAEQPANHYRLLGVPLWEPDPRVIEAAADRQMGHLRNYQTGPHAGESQRLLNEVAAARVCLLNPEKRAAYDATLRDAQVHEPAGAAADSQAVNDWTAAVPSPIATAGTTTTARRSKKPSATRALLTLVGILAFGLAGLGITYAVLSGAGKQEQLAGDSGQPQQNAKLAIAAAKPGQWIDLLANINPDKHSIAGRWAMKDGGLSVNPEKTCARVVMPTHTRLRSYDLLVEFTRHAGSNDISINLPTGQSACTLMIAGFDGTVTGLRMVNGKDTPQNGTGKAGPLVNGRRYRFEVQVRIAGADVDISVLLDGAPYLRWKGPQTALSTHPDWSTQRAAVSVGAIEPTTFHTVRLCVHEG